MTAGRLMHRSQDRKSIRDRGLPWQQFRELHPGHKLLRERIINTSRRRALVVAMCEHGVMDTLIRRGYDATFTTEEKSLIEDFINRDGDRQLRMKSLLP